MRASASRRFKRRLMLSVAAATVTLLATPLSASTTTTDEVTTADVCPTGAKIHCITDKTTSVLKTSTATGVGNSAGPSNVYVFYDSTNGYGKIVANQSDSALVTLDSDNYVYSNGAFSNTDHSGAVGIKVDLSSSHSASGLHFENYEENTITGAAVYLDESATVYLTGSGSGKTGIWLDPGTGTGTLTGDIITYNGSTISINGDGSYGVRIDKGATLAGNLDLGGAIAVYQHTAKDTGYTGILGVYMNGYVSGNVGISSGGSVLASGAGSQGMFLSGAGVGGNVTIAGTLEAEGYNYYSSSSSYYYSTSTKKKTYPESGTALTINANIAKGVEIAGLNYTDDTSSSTGSVTAYGTGSAVLISPVVSVDTTTYTKSSPLVIGLYQSYDSDTKVYTYEQYDPGFGFYNRGTVSISPTNVNNSVEAGVKVLGTSALPTYINGGIFNSGSIGASATTDDKKYSVTATGLSLSGKVYVGGYYDAATGTYYKDSISCTKDVCTYSSGIPSTILNSNGTVVTKSAADAASLVNSNSTGSGTISASVSGKGGGIATALYISADSRVTSLINSGSITAAASTTTTSLTSPVAAYGIYDLSGTLTYIKNSGTITAAATTLDSDEQIARAIDLSAVVSGMDAYNGVTIVNTASSTGSAKITGDIVFGAGSNQKIYISGSGSNYSSSITGDIYYGSCGSATCTGNDVLSIGAFGYVSGSVTAASGVSISIANNGLLYLTNDKDSGVLKANDLTVADGGYFSIGVKQDSGLNTTGIIQASGKVDIAKGANVGLAFNSYLSGGDYTLIHSTGGLNVSDLSTYSHDISTPIIANGKMPFLFSRADISTRYYDANHTLISSCTGKGSCSTAYSTSDLILSVTPKSADPTKYYDAGGNIISSCTGKKSCSETYSSVTPGLGLTGYGKQIFGVVNTAVAKDDELGAAMVNGIHANVDDLTATGASSEAQKAYDSFAPNVSGGTRAIAIGITDQATGVVGARQRSLRMYAKSEGEMTLWAQEFVMQIKNPGTGAVQEDGSREKSGFKDHGFGVVLGMDAGDAKSGWYGGALTFYNGDVNEVGRTAHENQLWFVATGYSTWRGRGLFLDTKVDLGYASIKGQRMIHLNLGTGTSQTAFVRYAQSSHSAAMISGGLTGGAFYTYGSFTFSPQVSLDGLFLRENGYTEKNPYTTASTDADGFDLTVRSHEAKSLRSFLGTNLRYDFNFDGYFLQPELRLGYRYDFLTNPARVRAAFKDVDPDTLGNQTGTWFRLTGPAAAQGSFVLGSTVGLTSGAWSLNLNYDFVRGTNSNTEQVATVNLIGRI